MCLAIAHIVLSCLHLWRPSPVVVHAKPLRDVLFVETFGHLWRRSLLHCCGARRRSLRPITLHSACGVPWRTVAVLRAFDSRPCGLWHPHITSDCCAPDGSAACWVQLRRRARRVPGLMAFRLVSKTAAVRFRPAGCAHNSTFIYICIILHTTGRHAGSSPASFSQDAWT